MPEVESGTNNTDIFVSYAGADKERVRTLVAALEAQGWKIFWDQDVLPGDDWELHIGGHLDVATVVIAVWSKASVRSRFVRSEANRAERRNALVPVTIDDVDPPLGFDHLQSENLVEWLVKGGGVLPVRLRSSISRRISRSTSNAATESTTKLPPSESQSVASKSGDIDDSVPRLLLSYAAKDSFWVRAFTDSRWFGRVLGEVVIMEYRSDKKSGFEGLRQWLDRHASQIAVAIVFVSSTYLETEFNLMEWRTSLTKGQLGQLVFVPVLLDADAKHWWAEQRRQGDLALVPSDFTYADFTNSNGQRVDIRPEDSLVMGHIAMFAKAVRDLINRGPASRFPLRPA